MLSSSPAKAIWSTLDHPKGVEPNEPLQPRAGGGGVVSTGLACPPGIRHGALAHNYLSGNLSACPSGCQFLFDSNKLRESGRELPNSTTENLATIRGQARAVLRRETAVGVQQCGEVGFVHGLGEDHAVQQGQIFGHVVFHKGHRKFSLWSSDERGLPRLKKCEPL